MSSGAGTEQKLKQLFLTAVAVGCTAIFFAALRTPSLPSEHPGARCPVEASGRDRPAASEGGPTLPLLSKDELRRFDGSVEGQPIYLAIAGRVFDVTNGARHYAPGGGYDFFAGVDGSRAFVTGDFTPEGLTDDVSGFSAAQHLELLRWIDGTYAQGNKAGYTEVGRVAGYWFVRG